MNIIPLTLFISLGLALLFIALFARELNQHAFRSAESDSLLPLAEEKPCAAHSAKADKAAPAARCFSPREQRTSNPAG